MKTQSVSQYCRVTQATHLIAVNSQCNSAVILDLTRAVISDPVPLYERNTAVCCCYASRARALYVAHAAPPCIRIHRNLFPTAMNAAKPHHEPIDALSGSALHDWSTPSSQIRAPHKTIKNNADTKEFRLSHQTSVCEEAMSELVLTPDEHYLIGGSNSGSVYIWNLLTGSLVLLPQLHSDCITMIVPRRCHASSLSTLLFTASRDASVHVVDGTQMILNGAALSCDSNSSPAQSGSMCMPMNPMRARQEAVLCTVQRAVKCVRGVLPFSLNPGLLLSWGDDGLVRILDITHFDNVVEIFTHAASQPILHALLDPVHERYIFLALENGEVRALDIYFQEFSCSETRWDNSEDICLIKNLNGKFSKMFWSQTTADKSDNNESTSQTIVISTQEGIVHFLEIDLPIHDDTGRAWKRSPTDPQKLNFKEPGFLNIPRAQNFFHSFPEVSQRTVKEHARVSAVLSSSVTLPFEVNCFTAIYESPFEMFPLKLHPVLRRFPERNLTDTDLVLPVEICSSFPQSVLDILGITMSRKARKRQNYEHQLNHMQEVSCKTVNPLSSETTTPAKCDLENTLNDGARKKSKRDDVAIDEVDGIQVLQVQAEVDALSKECQKLKRLKGKLANEIMLYHK